MQKVIEARAQATSIKLDAQALSDPATFKKFEDKPSSNLSGALSRLLVVAGDNILSLKANQNFRDLQAQIEGTENRIAVARKRYVESVQTYNTKVRSFPYNLTAQYLPRAQSSRNVQRRRSSSETAAGKILSSR